MQRKHPVTGCVGDRRNDRGRNTDGQTALSHRGYDLCRLGRTWRRLFCISLCHVLRSRLAFRLEGSSHRRRFCRVLVGRAAGAARRVSRAIRSAPASCRGSRGHRNEFSGPAAMGLSAALSVRRRFRRVPAARICIRDLERRYARPSIRCNRSDRQEPCRLLRRMVATLGNDRPRAWAEPVPYKRDHRVGAVAVGASSGDERNDPRIARLQTPTGPPLSGSARRRPLLASTRLVLPGYACVDGAVVRRVRCRNACGLRAGNVGRSPGLFDNKCHTVEGRPEHLRICTGAGRAKRARLDLATLHLCRVCHCRLLAMAKSCPFFAEGRWAGRGSTARNTLHIHL